MAFVDPSDPCVHCGFCLPTCASYRVLGTEMDSPRGRIHTLKAIEAGELEMDATVASHFDSCLGCFACVTACPSGVRYDQLIEATRPKLNQPEFRSSWQTSFRQLLLMVLPYPNRLRALLQPLRAYAGTRLQRFTRKTGLLQLMGPQLAAMEALLPPLPPEGFTDHFPRVNPAQGEQRGRVGLVLGCVQRCFDPGVNEATVAVLQANGYEVVIPAHQGCCGAVSHHQGQLQQTKELASALVQSFSEEALDAVLVAASGCGHTMKAYGELLNGAGNFTAPVLDVHEFLAHQGLSDSFRQALRPLPCTVAYHDACHMIHGQGIAAQPRDLLRAIPQLRLREATEAGVCCGSAGIYNLVQPDEAAELGQLKADDLSSTGAEIVASANIGCSLQLRRYLRQDGPKVEHPMELLARSAGVGPFSPMPSKT
ncbi:glycolate oxidase iron-sulfur subunit [Synechococcus sp. SYN20]|uniref:(Fe-S)-binding protein n=1 Tax=Synechococcus sp. SYN20 TaxID=1050714 RepID=UPI001648C39B|nr:(Fe-S)-binding protein [Synechococcus sp. SYN20]QNJ24633.1 glycolate oxidase iron-sulfur subunit [Synechococcus sp. SYN20]